LDNQLSEALQDPSNIVRVQEDGHVVREMLLMGPYGAVKMETIWDGLRLITAYVYGG